MKYTNLDGERNVQSVKALLAWNRERRAKVKDLTVRIPHAEKKETAKLQKNTEDFSITWIGHSTFLIQAGGKNIVTDPVWAGRMGTEKRATEPGLSLKELPDINVVLISHGHYDHLHYRSISKLPGNPVYLVPAGLKKPFRRRGYKNTVEAQWYDGFQEGQLRFTFVPAQHWTRRLLFDTNTSHWGGWIIEDLKNDTTVYFAGDTGYFDEFKEIAGRFHPDYVLMPIGCYEPEWFMKMSHINPEDAIRAFQEMNGSWFIPMHYGAYRLADDTGPEALARLYKEWHRLSLPEETLLALKIGETHWGVHEDRTSGVQSKKQPEE